MTSLTRVTPLNPKPPAIPPLQNGDRLTRVEFERRYNAMPHVHKAELIEGVVYMPSPVTHSYHGNPHFSFIAWLSYYTMYTPGVEGGDNGSIRLDLSNEPQPDAYLIVLPEHGGRVQIDDDGYITGAPEWVGEVSASSVSIDLNAKLMAYQRNDVREYVVWRVFDRAIDWFVLRKGQFEPLPLGMDGLYHSEVLPGLRLDPAALINGDLVALHQIMQQAIATPEHASFVALLGQAGGHKS